MILAGKAEEIEQGEWLEDKIQDFHGDKNVDWSLPGCDTV
jgi:hypothetical protein